MNGKRKYGMCMYTVYLVKYYLAIKTNAVLSFEVTWRKQETLSKAK
jgi:hypothetical protein